MSSTILRRSLIRVVSFTARASRRVRTAAAGVVVGCVLASLGAAGTTVAADDVVTVAEPFDPEVVLPARVDSALHRTYDALNRAIGAVDDRRRPAARRALRATRAGFLRSNRAVLRQVQAPPPAGEDSEEATGGPDSSLAALNVEQVAVTSLAGLFDRLGNPRLVRAVKRTLVTAQKQRARLITVVTGLDPEGAGADYADPLADTVPAYADEVAAIAEALADDRLTSRARSALKFALARSKTAEARMAAAFGGGE